MNIHEDRHVDIIKNGYEGKGGFNGVIEEIIGQTDEDAKAILDQRDMDTQTTHNDYDAKTRHRATEEAVLDRSR